MKKLLGLLLIIMIILPSLSFNILAKENNTNESTNNESSKESLIEFLLRKRFEAGSLRGIGKFFVQQLRPPVALQAYPSTLSLSYNERKYFEIGGKSRKTNDWIKMGRLSGGYNFGWTSRLIKFKFELAEMDNSSMDVWNVEFDPEVLQMYPSRKTVFWPGADQPFKTNVSIMLKPNVDPRIATQDTVLKINIIKEELADKIGILKGTPEYVFTQREEYIKKCEEVGLGALFSKPINVILWKIYFNFNFFILNLPLPNYEKGLNSVIEILIKVDKYHQAEIKPLDSSVKIEPYQVKSIPINIKNLGSHIDTYNFRVKCDNKNIVVTPPPALTVEPGEEKEALVGVAAPRNFYSVGDVTPIYVEAYSIDDPDTIFSNTITLKTSGIYATGSSTIYLGVIIVIFVIILFLYVYLSKKYKQKLKEIKNKNKEDEFFINIHKRIKKSLNKTVKLIKKRKKTVKKKSKKKIKKPKEKIKPVKEKPVELKKEKEEIVDKKPSKPKPEKTPSPEPSITTPKKPEIDDTKKKQAIQRALQQQEKQKRKYNA